MSREGGGRGKCARASGTGTCTSPGSGPTCPEPSGKSSTPSKKGTQPTDNPHRIPSHPADSEYYSLPGQYVTVGPPSSAIIFTDSFTAKMTKYTTTLSNEDSPSPIVPTFEVLHGNSLGSVLLVPWASSPFPEPL